MYTYKLLTVLFYTLLIFPLVHAQNSFEYTYDAAGNRTSRTLVVGGGQTYPENCYIAIWGGNPEALITYKDENPQYTYHDKHDDSVA
ncbi:MAG: hypothetical protein GXO83_10535, partial [Chlorobi bacterium]|nr:hypothetical protein [Chlorobiota bacterium]